MLNLYNIKNFIINFNIVRYFKILIYIKKLKKKIIP